MPTAAVSKKDDGAVPAHWLMNETDRALTWKVPFSCVIQYVKGTSVLSWNMHAILPYNSEEDARTAFDATEISKPVKGKEDSTIGLVLMGVVKGNGKFSLTDKKGTDTAVTTGVLFSRAENNEDWEVSVGLTKAAKTLVFSDLCVPMSDSVWYDEAKQQSE